MNDVAPKYFANVSTRRGASSHPSPSRPARCRADVRARGGRLGRRGAGGRPRDREEEEAREEGTPASESHRGWHVRRAGASAEATAQGEAGAPAVQRRDGAQFAHEVHQGGVDHHRFAGDVRAVPGPHEQDPRVGVLESPRPTRDRRRRRALVREGSRGAGGAGAENNRDGAGFGGRRLIARGRRVRERGHGCARARQRRARPRQVRRRARLGRAGDVFFGNDVFRRRRRRRTTFWRTRRPSPNERIYPFENTRSAGWREGCRRKRKRFVRPDARFDRRAGEGADRSRARV